MQVELGADEIESLIEGIDCLKTKISFAKGASYEEKTRKLIAAEAIEKKLRRAQEGV